MNERKTKGLTNLNSDEKIIRDTCVSLARMYFSQFAAISCSTPTAGYVVACTWTGSGHTWQLTGPTVLLKLCWHPEFWSSFINKHALLMQTEAVVHCQIQQQTITCCNAELSLSNHRYIATWTLDGKNIWQNLRWSFGVHYLHLKNVGSMLLTIQHEITPLFLLMFDIKH